MNEIDASFKPKYLQLVDILRHDILDGRFKEGDLIPSENELRRKYTVSSTTVRKTFDILKNYGLIKRESRE